MKFIALALLMLSPAIGVAGLPSFERNVLHVKLSPGVKPAELTRAPARRLFGDVYELRVSDAVTAENEFLKLPQVEWVERSFYGEARSPSRPTIVKANKTLSVDGRFNDPLSAAQWGLRDASANGSDVLLAYEQLPSRTPTLVTVAVIDTGVDYRHEDLKANVWSNALELPGNGIDDDKNGYVDDVFGIDTLDNDTDPMASIGHGTHVAGIIAAAQNNRKGIAGVAQNARLMSLRAVPDNTDEKDSDVAEAMLYAAKNGARVVNCSFAKSRASNLLKETIEHLGKRFGVLVVAAAGNDSYDNRWHSIDRHRTYPASLDSSNMLVVTATDQGGRLASFSNVGTVSVDVGAPGDRIVSTLPRNDYGHDSGTSMAAPFVAGMAAEILAYYPQLSVAELKRIILESVVLRAPLQKRTLTGGQVSLLRAFELAERIARP